MSEPYQFPTGIPIDPVPQGTTLLVSGPSLSPAEDVARTLIADGSVRNEGVLFVSTGETAEKFLAGCRRTVPSMETERVGLVDCTGQDIGQSDSGMQVKYVSTQSDLTGIGMKYSALYESLYANAEAGRVRTGLISLSSLLMYNDLRQVFRFAQTITSRIDSAGGVGVFSIDPTTHDERTVNMFHHVVDGLVEVRETEGDGDADGELRVRGLRDQPDGWQPFDLPSVTQN
jgi:KaiC/GvpD/RAD55 family RecA-like ATPase